MDEAAALGRVVGAGAVLAIGGGSPIDCGKCAAALLANPGVTAEDLFCCRFRPRTALPLAAVPLTHGVGSEVNRFAVAALPRQRRASVIAHDCLYPRYAVEDPALMTGLSPDQTRYVSVDALSRVVEAATTTVSNPFVVMLARETVRLVHRWLPAALQCPDDLEARYGLCLAAIQAGLAFDNGLLHMAHALEQPLRGVCDAPHGLRLAVLLPAVVRECYPACAPVAADILAPLAPGLRGLPEEAPKAARAVEQWLFSVGLTQKLLNLGVRSRMWRNFVRRWNAPHRWGLCFPWRRCPARTSWWPESTGNPCAPCPEYAILLLGRTVLPPSGPLTHAPPSPDGGAPFSRTARSAPRGKALP
jgi:alcohol dehydrogenase class IV